MTRATHKKTWEIQGWDGTELLFQCTIGVGQITQIKMEELIRTLTAKISLNEREILSSYAKKGTKAHFDHLEVQYLEGKTVQISCGTNPYVIATVKNM